MSFPLCDKIGDAVQQLLDADAVTKLIDWQRGEAIYDDPTTVPINADEIPNGFILVHDIRIDSYEMGGLDSAKRNLSNYKGVAPVQVTLVARDSGKDQQIARRNAENMLTNVLRVLVAGLGDGRDAQTLGGLVKSIQAITARTDGEPKVGLGTASALIEYWWVAPAYP